MHKVEFNFIGGTRIGFTEVSNDVIDRILNWLEGKIDTKTFEINTPKQNTSCIIRKELILFVNII